MEIGLENKVKQEDSWIKRAFKEEWPTMINHLVSCGTATGAATGFSYYAPRFLESDAAISGIATAIDMASYWSVFLPQLWYRDKKRLKGADGKVNREKMVKKMGEYLSYMGVLECVYAISRFSTQYYLQRKGWDPATASLTIQLSATALFTFAFPPIRYAARKWSEK